MGLALVLGISLAGCGTSATVATSPSPQKCQVSLVMPQGAINAAGGTGAITVTTQAECAWTVSAGASWITGLTPTSGQGSGQVQFQVAPNPSAATRLADLTLNDQHAAVTQAAAQCVYGLSSRTLAVPPAGGPGTFQVTAMAGCAWTASSQAPWVQVTSGASGSGSGTVNFTAAANAGSARVGLITIADQTFQVTEDAAAGPTPCAYSLDVTAQALGSSAGTATTTVRSDPACSWTAASNATWMSIAGTATGSGNRAVSINVAANTGSARTGTATIAGQTFTVTQSGSCATSINPASQSIGAAGGSGIPIAVTTATGCAWTAATTDSWITITAGASGNGNGTVNFSVAAGSGPARIGALIVAGQTFTVTQASGCSYAINPSSQSIGAAGGAGSAVSVTTATGCAWTSTTAATWITITSGASGSGNGAVNFTAAANTGGNRTGTVTIAGQTFTLTQTTGCAYGISPNSQSIGTAGGAGSAVSVTTAAGCAWTATTTDTWISITSATSGSGNGTVNFTAAANTGPGRTGTITIGGQTFTLTQATGCSYGINPTSQSMSKNGGAGSPIAVTTAAGCTWTATTADAWLSITSGATGTGNGTVGFTAAANTGPLRTGTILIASQTFTVTEANGCSYAINPGSQSMNRDGGSGSFTVTSGAGCTWTATTTDTWLTVTSGANGSGNGTISFSGIANPGAARTGTITIAGLTFSVNQQKH